MFKNIFWPVIKIRYELSLLKKTLVGIVENVSLFVYIKKSDISAVSF